MAHVSVDNEYDELYRSRKIRIMLRLSRDWALICASIDTASTQVALFLRRDQPQTSPHIRKLTFATEQECGDYLLAKRLELEAEGWREEVGS